MRKLRWQLIVVLLALAMIGGLLITQQQTSLPGSETADQPVAGGIYVEALIGSLGRLNPVLDYYNSPDYDVDHLIYSGLVKFDARGLPYGDLAEGWGISQDGKKYSFAIRSDAYWHDGQPVTSADVAFTIDLMRSDDIPLPDDLRSFWKQVEVLEIDQKTIQFSLPEAFAPFLDYLSFGVLPRHKLEGIAPANLVNDPYNLAPVGSGPFKFRGLEVDGDQIKALTLEGNPDYYGQKPFIQTVVFRYYPDEAAAMTAYRGGEVMGISQVTGAALKEALAEPNLKVYTGRLPRLAMLYVNLDNPSVSFFQNNDIRKAIMLGINRRWMVDRVLGGQAVIANGPIFPESWAYFEGYPQFEYDPDQAVSLLKKAEYTVPAEGGNVREKEGVKLAFELAYPDTEMYTQIAKRIQSDLAKIGVQVDLKAAPYNELVSDYLEPRTYEAALVEINLARSPDPDPYPFWHQAQIGNGQNYSQWDDRQVSEYLEQARVSTDLTERTRRYRNFQVRFADQMPALPLFYPVYSYAVDAGVRGVSMGPLYDPSDRFNSILTWYVKTAAAGLTSKTTQTP